ncbi:hypothetical protein [Nocardia sp. NPDC051832]|uniref:hypothetical protein n=1 Tax=Nocardia sp. NPDC051832 TaxID=3155673 RepID=UPI0034233000
MSNHESDSASMIGKFHRWWTDQRSTVVDSSVVGLFGLELGKFLFEEHADEASRAMMIARLASAVARAAWSLTT